MNIQLSKFGTTLLSRPLGKEAWAAFSSSLKEIKENELIQLDFDGVVTFSPSWGDEFLTPLIARFGDRLILRQTTNPSVKETLELLEKIHKIKFRFA